jgi:hypothetical protein
MLTKNQYCYSIIEQFSVENDIKPEEVNENHILSSSSLAVVMEFLGRIQNEDLREYAKSRSGVITLGFDQEKRTPYVLTVRELLETLPDE